MTWQELTEASWKAMELPLGWHKMSVPKKAAEKGLKTAFEIIAAIALKGERVVVPGFGTFILRSRKARQVRNPSTGVMMEIPAGKTVGFRPSSNIKK